MTLTLHSHPFASYCWKALTALYERDLPFVAKEVADPEDRARLTELWPFATMPVLVDDANNVTVAESTIVIEYLDRFGDAAPLIPAHPEAALQARLWDRTLDGQVHTPMQKIVHDNLRPEGSGDSYGVKEAKAKLDIVYPILNTRLRDMPWMAGESFTLADCAAAPALYYARVVHQWDEKRYDSLTHYFDTLIYRPSVARVIDEARPFRQFLPLPWPEYAQ
jgi:glutathione S-transferase